MTTREERGIEIYNSDKLFYKGKGMWGVEGKQYSFNENVCNCQDKMYRCGSGRCKHNYSCIEWLKYNEDPRRKEIINQKEEFKDLVEFMQKEDLTLKVELYNEFDTLVDEALDANIIVDAGSYFLLVI